MQRYELLYIIPGSIEDEKVAETAIGITTMLTGAGARVFKDEAMGKRKLAYPINHIRMGHYQLLEFDLEPRALQKLEQDIRLSSAVLRHTIVRVHVRTPEQLAATAQLRERIAAKREAREEAEVRTKLQAEAESKRVSAEQAPAAPPPEVSKEELDRKIEELLEDDGSKNV